MKPQTAHFPQIFPSLYPMQGKHILLGISGSIAAYKTPILLRLLRKAGADVRIVMTSAAEDFVSPLVLSTLSGEPVHSSLSDGGQWANHVMLGRWADLMVIAPASCNTLAKMGCGLCDNLLLATYLSAPCPVMIAPAMDEDMWQHASTRENIARLRARGHQVLDTEYGELASGLTGQGRMPEPETLFDRIQHHFANAGALQGMRALVTAGPTYENIDPVRFIGNYSSGKMGVAIAEALAEAGCLVELVLGPSALQVNHPNIRLTRVVSAGQMFDACNGLWPSCRIGVMSAAVADYAPSAPVGHKLKKDEHEMQLTLTRTQDILASLGKQKKKGQVLIGFALETSKGMNYARKKLTEKNADAIVLNTLEDEGAGFGHDTNRITLLERDGNETAFELKSKMEVAHDLLKKIIEWTA